MSSSGNGSGGLETLLAACGQEPAGDLNQAEIKVIEVDAYASVADLIQAAIIGNGGAATLKEIYDVCELHGRIAYRKAGGSRLIVANEHWKSQIRHALYTGHRFRRVPSNSDYWQLSNPDAPRAELVKVLVRTDDDSIHIYAALSLKNSFPVPVVGRQQIQSKSRRKPRREGMSDTADIDYVHRGSGRRKRRFNDVDGSDNHSTQQSDGDDLAQPRRTNRRKPALAPAPLYNADRPFVFSRPSITYKNSGNSDDPSTLRWGSTGLRSSVLVADDSSFSVGRGTPGPNARRILLNSRPKSPSDADADSPPNRAKRIDRDPRPNKRLAVEPVLKKEEMTHFTPAVGEKLYEALKQLQSLLPTNPMASYNPPFGFPFAPPSVTMPLCPPSAPEVAEAAMNNSYLMAALNNQGNQQHMIEHMQALLANIANRQ